MDNRSYPLGLPLPAPRRPGHRRTASSSSEASHTSHTSRGSHASEDQFVLSPMHTPASEDVPPRVVISRYATDPLAAGNGLLMGKVHDRPRGSETIRRLPSFLKITPSSRSKPIAIDQALARKADPTTAVSTFTPPEPVSARGDPPGGYFPLHEDPESRRKIPDTDMARHGTMHRAAESSRSGSDARSLPPAHAAPSTASASVDTPISSYIPSGLHDDVVLPMGKYYPSNWERRHGKTPQPRPPTQPTSAPVIRSEPHIPKYPADHPKPGSDIKRRLQQYQRDMVAQAAMAANALLARRGSAGDGGDDRGAAAAGARPSSVGTSSITTTAAATGTAGGHAGTAGTAAGATSMSLPKAQLAATFLRTHKPLSPRLQPVGSPGPVTPMSLEADSYLALGSPAAAAAAAAAVVVASSSANAVGGDTSGSGGGGGGGGGAGGLAAGVAALKIGEAAAAPPRDGEGRIRAADGCVSTPPGELSVASI